MTFNLTTFSIVALCKAITKSINHINDSVRERMRKRCKIKERGEKEERERERERMEICQRE